MLTNMSNEKKKPKAKQTDRHRPRRMVAIPSPIADTLEVWARAKYSDLATEVRAAVMAYMLVNGLTIPPPDTSI